VSHFGGEHRLRVFENTAFRKIFGPQREEDISWRKLHNYELHGLYYSPNIVFLKALTFLRGPLAYPNGLLD